MKKKKKCSVREHPTGRETLRNKTVNKERTHLNKNTYNHGGMCRGGKFKKDKGIKSDASDEPNLRRVIASRWEVLDGDGSSKEIVQQRTIRIKRRKQLTNSWIERSTRRTSNVRRSFNAESSLRYIIPALIGSLFKRHLFPLSQTYLPLC